MSKFYNPMSTNAKELSNDPYDSYMSQYDSYYNSMYEPQGIQEVMQEDDEDENEEKDRQYMLSLYPDLFKRIQYLSEEECNKLEYEGSFMYDEYPDKREIDKIVTGIYVILEKEQDILKAAQEVETLEKDVVANQIIIPVRNPWLWDNVQVGFLNELFGRRRRRYPRRYRYDYPPYQRYRPRPYAPYRSRPYLPYRPYVPYYYRYY